MPSSWLGLLLLSSSVRVSDEVLLLGRGGVYVIGNLSVSQTIFAASVVQGSDLCCMPTGPSTAVRGNGFLQPVVSLDFESDGQNGSSAATRSGPYPMIALNRLGTGSTTPNYACTRKGGRCASFAMNGNSILYSRGALPGLPLGDSSFSVSLWFQTASAGNGSIGTFYSFGSSNNNQINALRIGWSCWGIQHYFWGNDQWFGVPYLCDNVWHHLVIVYDAILYTRTLYFDGNSGTNTLPSGPPAVAPGALIIGGGARNYHESFWGNMDDFKIYDVVLNSSMITALYNS